MEAVSRSWWPRWCSFRRSKVCYVTPYPSLEGGASTRISCAACLRTELESCLWTVARVRCPLLSVACCNVFRWTVEDCICSSPLRRSDHFSLTSPACVAISLLLFSLLNADVCLDCRDSTLADPSSRPTARRSVDCVSRTLFALPPFRCRDSAVLFLARFDCCSAARLAFAAIVRSCFA